ncbi:MAG: hypothetical protein AAGF11_12675 [Myxococcota bacterium]
MDKIHVTLAIHWEGRHLDGVEYLASARARLLPGVPVTHFVSSAYFARGGNIETIVEAMLPAFESNDEVALHVPAWRSVRGAAHEPGRTVVVGEDPELIVEYPGITSQIDRGYTLPISGHDKPTIESFIVTSKLLLRPLLSELLVRRKLVVERMLRGIRAGHGMASDMFLAAACNAGFAYDASGMDSVWARAAGQRAEADAERGVEMFAPLWNDWARLWGPQEQADPYFSNRGAWIGTRGAGINANTQPFFIAHCGSSRLLELPLNGGVVPPTNPEHIAELLSNSLESPPGVSRTLSLAIRQETAEGCLDALLDIEAFRASRIHWTTNVDLLVDLLGEPPVSEPIGVRDRPLQALREQMAQGNLASSVAVAPAGPPPGRAVPSVVVPAIQVPLLKT